jgi:plastocyanin
VVPKYDSSNELIADVLSGNDGLSKFAVSGTGGFVRTAATKDRDAEIIQFESVPAVHVLQDELFAVQQSVRLVDDSNAASLGPGDTVEYTIAFQVSDYAVLDDTTIQFTVPDGQIFNSADGVSLIMNGLLTEAGGLKPWAVKPENVSLDKSGTQTYIVRIADELRNVGLNGRLDGAATSKGLGVAVTGTLTYRAVLQDSFSGTVPSGDVSVDEGDLFQSTVTATAKMVDQETGLVTNFVTSDDSGTRSVLKKSPVQTSVYAINGKTSPSSVAVTAGDLVTFRVNRQVRSGDVENLDLSSYLPMPVFSISGLQWASGKESLPGENQIQFGAKDTFRALLNGQPKLSVDTANNRLSVSFGCFVWLFFLLFGQLYYL